MKQTSTKRLEDLTWLGGKGYPLGIVQEIDVWPYYQIVHVQTRICPGEWDSLRFWDTNRSSYPSHKTRPYDNKKQTQKRQKRENLQYRGFCRII